MGALPASTDGRMAQTPVSDSMLAVRPCQEMGQEEGGTMTEMTRPPRRIGRSAIALLVGFIVCAALSLATDQIFHTLGVFPPLGEPMPETNLLLLALSYRLVYDGLGSYIAAWLAPSAPMLHAMLLGAIGQVFALVGIHMGWNLGPHWYPIALAVSVLPTAWIGGWLYTHRRRG
jgi:hypothetical protein